jgi:Protein of unknown function (DUF1579)
MSEHETAPTRGAQHEALAAFLGRWRATGKSFAGPKQSADNPKGAAEPWISSHVGMWHTGEFFLIQDERATIGARPFDTLSVLGVDASTGNYFARCFENHGFYRHYELSVAGSVWTLKGDSERALIEFSADGRTQTIVWEWRPKDHWLPLCDRVAVRED